MKYDKSTIRSREPIVNVLTITMSNWVIYYIVWQLIIKPVTTWHGFSNENFHCWPYDANSANPTPFTECKGIKIKWIVEPPLEIKAQEHFNTTYELIIEPEFYTWGIPLDFFTQANVTGISDAALAEQWCKDVICPAPSLSTPENCCVHHVNVHSCPLGETDTVQNGLCGPWIPPSGSVFTHSKVMVGPVGQGNWTSTVAGLYAVGETSVIAHFKLARMHIAIEKRVNVLPRTICGDGRCERSEGEECSSCPKDCGECPLEDWEIALIVTFIIIILIIFLGIIIYFRYQKRKLLWDESWIIPDEDIKEDSGLRGAFGSMLSIVSGGSQQSGSVSAMATSAVRRQVFATTAFYDGRTVAVKRIKKSEFLLTKVIRNEVKTVREMDHPNLCKFIGGCIKVPNVCIVSEYCPKGSLNDVLLNDDIPLSWSFRFSFGTDIARGVSYLHSRSLSHGRLTSSNCVVDDRWTVKITDFGLKTYREEDILTDEAAEEFQYKERQRNVYVAPEIRTGYCGIVTESADAYSFAILLVEIANRNDPYGDEDVWDLPEDWMPPLPAFSDIEDKDNICPCPFEYCKLIKECWSEKPADRPSFDVIKKTLHKINPSKLSPVDLMMAMMEKYSKHLESIVVERTQDLVAEKQKTDKLLYSMLPRTVADQLRQGQTVNAEAFDACTIYFSDIVGFTDLSGGSTPMQIIALLNKLYTTFDEIIDRFDVYKVETIGDAYMVVSGLPIRTPFHAREIASMALDIADACKRFVIPHRPNEPLKVRVGLHSGPVCTGVVGLKMPRYCLFGDTVNTASRMESNGEAYRVHISSSTHSCLEETGGYIFEKRGAIPIKGKGEMVTWWLIAHDRSKSDNSGDDDNDDHDVGDDAVLIKNRVNIEDTEDIPRKDSANSSHDSGYNDKNR